MDELMKFEFVNKEKLECLELDGKPLFNPMSVGECLGISDSTLRVYVSDMNDNQRVNIRHLTKDEKFNLKLKKGDIGFWLTESGLYQLIFKSRKPEAQKFVSWITDDVLPEIRKTGSFNNKNNQLIQNFLNTTEQLLGIRREELAILQDETPNKKLSNLMVDSSRHGLGAMRDLYKELFYVFECETGIDVQGLASMQKLSRREYLKQNQSLCKTVYDFAYQHFHREDRQIFLVQVDSNQVSLMDFQ
jgi:prophage antirepressor-like protein